MLKRYEGKRPESTPERHRQVVLKMREKVNQRLIEINELLKTATPKDARELLAEKKRLALMSKTWK